MKRKMNNILVGLLFGFFAFLVGNTETVYAATGTVTFGSESYNYEGDQEFPIGVYIDGDERMGTYHVEISYDRSRMEYVGGAEREDNGIIILEGTATGTRVKYMLEFNPISGGEAYIEVKYAQISSPNGTKFEIVETDEAPISIEGEDTAVELPQRHPTIGGKITLAGKTYYVLDLMKVELADEQQIELQKIEGEIEGEKIVFLTNREKNAKFLYLVDNTNELFLYGYCEEDKSLYSCEKAEYLGKTYYLTSAKVCTVWPEKLSLDIVNNQAVYYGIDEEGNSGFYQFTEDRKLVEWNSEEAKDAIEQNMWIYMLIGDVVILVVAFMVIRAIVRVRRNRRKRRKREYIIIDLNEEDVDFVQDGTEEVEEVVMKEEPVISVQNVTMEFKVSTSNASGIKEYIIQFLKRQINYREFKALDNVSFDIYKGEVVGIIGTNGSGKSTILKIVSGALKPSSGTVKVDTRKIQLLTLGTGFDMELTAKENVYLNGAIIGLSKEFLDAHYQEIVDFAELDGFMEEKVKNFSSGMVSRLGFAIATVGEVSEILILDEVLSVGDEFFRKKSLAKVKEMIHSGATVLMVSHSTQTIIENCTKAVWIEKGKLMKVGSPKSVCWAYKKNQIKRDVK